MNLAYFNDGKEKSQSHEISIKEEDFYNSEYDVFSHNPFYITGYGETKEDALEDFKKKFDYIMRELKAFEILLHETDLLESNIVNVDCFKHSIK